MTWLVDPLLMLLIMLNFFVLGASRLRPAIRVVGAQGVILGVLPLIIHGAVTWHEVAVSTGAIMLKGFVIPRMLDAGLGAERAPREVQPFVGFIASLMLGATGTGLAVLFAQTLPLRPEHVGLLVVPAALSGVLTGFWVLMVRRRAVAHVLGILVLENAVFTFGLLLLDAIPSLVEVGVLLDVFGAVFVMGLLLEQVAREASAGTEPMTTLREE